MKAMRREIEGTDRCCCACGQRGRAEPVHAVHRFAGYDAEPFDDRAVGARPALERGAQAGGRVAPARRRVRGASVAGAWRADLQARTMAGEGGRRPGRGAEGARKRPRERRTAAAMQRIGELSMEVELLRADGRPALWPAGGRGDGRGDVPDHPPPQGRGPGLRELGAAAHLLSSREPGAGGRRRASAGLGAPRAQAQRGDEAMVAAIRADLERSPWTGDGREVRPARADRGRTVVTQTPAAAMREHWPRRPVRRTRSDAPNVGGRTEAPKLMGRTTAKIDRGGKVWLFGVAEH